MKKHWNWRTIWIRFPSRLTIKYDGNSHYGVKIKKNLGDMGIYVINRRINAIKVNAFSPGSEGWFLLALEDNEMSP